MLPAAATFSEGDHTVGKQVVAPPGDARDKKITTAGWVLFFVMWGATVLVERTTQVRLQNVQYLAAGLILLGINGVRFAMAIPMSRLTLVVGLLALAGGILWQTQGEIPVYLMVVVTVASVLVVEGVLRLQGLLGPRAAGTTDGGASHGEPRRRKR